MKLGTIVNISFMVSMVMTVAGAYLKITHSEGAVTSLITAIIAGFVFIVSAITEVRNSIRIDSYEKNRWVIFLLLFSGIAGFIYFFISRKRIASNF